MNRMDIMEGPSAWGTFGKHDPGGERLGIWQRSLQIEVFEEQIEPMNPGQSCKWQDTSKQGKRSGLESQPQSINRRDSFDIRFKEAWKNKLMCESLALSGFVFNLYLFSWNMVEPSNSFYTVEGGGTLWNILVSYAQHHSACIALHCLALVCTVDL